MSDGVSDDDKSKIGRRNFLTTAALSAAAAAVGSAAGASAAEAQTINCAPVAGSVAWKQPGNNTHMLALNSGTPTNKGAVTIEYFGHCAFKLTSPSGLTMMFDPWRNDPSGAWGLWFPKEFPRTVVDICLSTHTHFDHDAIDRVDATSVLDRMIGTWSFADVKITAVPDKHSTDAPGWYKWINAVKEFGADPYPPNNPGHLDMVSFVVETGGMRILIWGDNRHNPPEEVWKQWGKIDVLTLPVDGSQHILSYQQGNAIVDRLKPKVVIPTHYLAEGTSVTLSTLQTADEWVKSQKSKKTLTAPKLTLDSSEMASMDREFLYFGNQASHG
ncbi:MAG: MBL fold metallo-hydrolase [Xanthobacteraceae bacterium]|nr:MBL fold metallo-hydrolase [Xanthobacteraceae bacterium]